MKEIFPQHLDQKWRYSYTRLLIACLQGVLICNSRAGEEEEREPFGALDAYSPSSILCTLPHLLLNGPASQPKGFAVVVVAPYGNAMLTRFPFIQQSRMKGWVGSCTVLFNPFNGGGGPIPTDDNNYFLSGQIFVLFFWV